MTKDMLQNVVVASLDDMCYLAMSVTDALLIRGFIDNLRQKAADKDQSDHFASEVAGLLPRVKATK